MQGKPINRRLIVFITIHGIMYDRVFHFSEMHPDLISPSSIQFQFYQRIFFVTFFDSYEAVFKNVTFTCNGEFPTKRKSCNSVFSFSGIKLQIKILSGRICCVRARSSSIIKIFSFFKCSPAGKFFGIFIGNVLTPFYFIKMSTSLKIKKVLVSRIILSFKEYLAGFSTFLTCVRGC
mgnify:CR=1 FL=1